MNIYTDIGHFICTAYQLNLQSMGWPDKQKAARDLQFIGKKKKRIPWNRPFLGAVGASWNLQLLESDKGSFCNQANTNIIRAYITIIMEITLMRWAMKMTSDRNMVSINTLQSLITSATRCKYVINLFSLLRIEKRLLD